jgi:hypothetical protein
VCRDVIEIMIPRQQVLRFVKQGIKVMTRSDWGKKKLKLLKPQITQRGHVLLKSMLALGSIGGCRLQTVNNIPG